MKLGALGAGTAAGASFMPNMQKTAAAQPVASPAAQVTSNSVEAALKQLETWTQGEMKSTGVPGIAIAVVYNDETIFAQGFGVREVGKPDLVDADTVFQLASVSKPIGSTVIAMLQDQGKVKWDDKIRDYLSDFEMYDPYVTREITVRDMYCHRSGLPEHAGDLLEDLGYNRDEVLRRLRFQEPDSSFRSKYAYTNFGMTAGAMAAANAAGMTWEALSEALLYEPLGMTSTSSRLDDFLARKNRARGHVPDGEGWAAKYQREPDAQTPAGGVSSSVNDMARWLRLHLAGGKFDGEQLVATEALAETHKPHMLTGFSPFTGLPGFYGLGWNVNYDPQGRLRLSHSGAFALGAATSIHLVPKEGLGIVVLTNAWPIGLSEGLATSFIDQALYGKPTEDWIKIYKDYFSQMVAAMQGKDYSKPPKPGTPALPNETYTGTYLNDFFGNIDIIAQGDSLALIAGPQKQTYPLTHYDRDIFTYDTQGENASGKSGVIFTVAPEGKASRVLIEALDKDHQGTFARETQP